MATAHDWLEGARLRTLPAAAAPVLTGAGAAAHLDSFSLGMSLLALGVALALQIGVNFANDYSDGVRGTDQTRVGPTRLTASGAVPPEKVLSSALISFAVAALFGIILVIWSQEWWLLSVGIAAIIAAWFYTGGRRPYGYMGVGLSEVFVFLFFGLVATVGTTYVQTHSAPRWVWIAGTGIGFISVALLMVNNIRDLYEDEKVGKYTLAVRLGERPARLLYVVLVVGAAIAGGIAQSGSGVAMQESVSVGFLLLAASAPGAFAISKGIQGRALLGTLRNTGLYALFYGILMGAVFAFGIGGIW